jgi:hypothetical protein
MLLPLEFINIAPNLAKFLMLCKAIDCGKNRIDSVWFSQLALLVFSSLFEVELKLALIQQIELLQVSLW